MNTFSQLKANRMKPILIPVDFQAASIQAIDYLKLQYQTENSDLQFLFVLPDANEKQKTEALSSFNKLQRSLLVNWTGTVSLIIKYGKIVDQIQEAIKETSPQLVLIGLSGKSMVKELIKLTDAPLLIIPANTQKNKIQRIIYANDYKEIQSSEALSPLRKLAQNNKATVIALHVEKDYNPNIDAAEDSLEYYLELINHEFVYIKSDNFPEAIQQYVHENKIDLLTLLLRDHGQNESHSKGELVARLLAESNVPILMLI